MKVNKKLANAALVTVVTAGLQIPAIAQTGSGYYLGFASKNPIDVRMSALYDRVSAMYDAGGLAPQERAELMRDLDGIQNYEIEARCTYPFGISKLTAQHLNRKLDFFSSKLDARAASAG